MPNNKRGRFTAKDAEFLRANATKMTVEEMAAAIKRDPETVAKWLSKRGIKNSEFYDTDEERARIKGELVSEPFWAHIRDQFTEGEQHYFVAQYCEHVVQMEKLASVEYTEKMQLVHLIRNEILMDRVLARQKNANIELLEAEKRLREIEDTGPDANVERKRLRDIIQHCSHTFSSYTREQKDIQDKINALRKELNMTRQQRVQDFNSVTKDFEGLVKNLQDYKFRESEGKELAVFRAAMEVEKARLTSWHKYADGKEDIPLLSVEVVEKLAEQEKRREQQS